MSSGGGSSRSLVASALIAALLAVVLVLLSILVNLLTGFLENWAVLRDPWLLAALVVGLTVVAVVLTVVEVWRNAERPERAALRESTRRLLWATPRQRSVTTATAVVLLVAIVGVGIATIPSTTGPGGGAPGPDLRSIHLDDQSYTVASVDVPEQDVLCEAQVAVLRTVRATVRDRCGDYGNTETARSALESGRIDMLWQYTGATWTDALGQERPIPGAAQQYEATRAMDLARNGLVWAAPTPFGNTLAMVTKQNVQTVSDFAALANAGSPDATLCADETFTTRTDGLPLFAQYYGIRGPLTAPRVTTLAPGRTDLAASYGVPCRFGVVSSTDWQISSLGLRVLADDREFFREGNAANTIAKAVVDRNDGVVQVSDAIAARLDDVAVRDLNGRMEAGQKPADVARDWLCREGLILC